MEKEFKNLGITSEYTTSAAAKKASCSTCGRQNASKKCKKRHRGCKEKRFCDAECEKQGHKKAEKDEEEEKPVDMAAAMDAALAKMARKEEKREVRKKKRALGIGALRAVKGYKTRTD